MYLKKKIFLVDTNLFIYKSFYCLNNKYKKIVNFKKSLNILINMIFIRYKKIIPNYIFFVFDDTKYNYRKILFNKYKSNRNKIENELKLYFLYVKNKLKNNNIKIIYKINTECDDVISTLVNKLNKIFIYNEIYILSYDKDFIQLVDNNVFLFKDLNNIFNKKKIYNKYGFYPYLLKDFLVLYGDKSDNIPGINGIGYKKALLILNNLGGIYNIFNSISKLKNIGINNKIINNLINNFYNIRL